MKRKKPEKDKHSKPGSDLKRWYLDSLETAPFGTLIHDESGKILFFNKYLETLTGYNRDTIPDIQTWIEKIYPDPGYRKMILVERGSQQPVGIRRVRDAIITAREGHKHLCRFTSTNSASGIRTVIVQGLDDEHQFATNAIEGYEKHQSQFQSTPTPLLAWVNKKNDFVLSTYNKAAEKLTGGQIGNYLGKSIRDLLEDPVVLIGCMQQCVSEKQTVECSEPYHLPGTDADSDFDCACLYVEPKFVIMHISIRTQFIRTRENLLESERRYLDLVDMLPITIFETDNKANVTFCNPSGLKTFEYSEKDIAKKLNVTDVLVEEDRDRAAANIARVMAGKKIGVSEYIAKTKSGRKIPIILRSSPIYSGDEFIGLRGFLIDVSELRAAQDALKHAYAGMEIIVAERTKELQAKTEELQEVNTALRVLLRDQHIHKNEIEDRIRMNARELIQPHLAKLHRSHLTPRQQSWLRHAVTRLEDITSPLGHTISTQFEKLTPTELQIADLIKNGKTTKEIADILALSIRTIESHRKNIRRKLGLQNRKVNLRTHLLSL